MASDDRSTIDRFIQQRKPAMDEAAKKPDTTAAAATLGSLGGTARAEVLTSQQRHKIAAKAASKRWNGEGK